MKFLTLLASTFMATHATIGPNARNGFIKPTYFVGYLKREYLFVTARSSSCRKVMFSQASVILFTRWVCIPGPRSPPGVDLPGPRSLMGMGWVPRGWVYQMGWVNNGVAMYIHPPYPKTRDLGMVGKQVLIFFLAVYLSNLHTNDSVDPIYAYSLSWLAVAVWHHAFKNNITTRRQTRIK